LSEVLIASLIVALIAAGTMMAFVAAARMTRAQSNPGVSEATGYVRETAEKFRNYIACTPPWFDTACAPTLPGGWQADPLPVGGGSNSILSTPSRRCYQVTPQDCDGVGGVGDCFAIEVRMCWNNDFTNCPC